MGVVRKPAKTPGPSARVVDHERFMALIGRGISNAEDCRNLGVNRRMGTRWSHGRVSRGADGVVREYGPVNAPAPRPKCL